jgi:hypothetical protein
MEPSLFESYQRLPGKRPRQERPCGEPRLPDRPFSPIMPHRVEGTQGRQQREARDGGAREAMVSELD